MAAGTQTGLCAVFILPVVMLTVYGFTAEGASISNATLHVLTQDMFFYRVLRVAVPDRPACMRQCHKSEELRGTRPLYGTALLCFGQCVCILRVSCFRGGGGAWRGWPSSQLLVSDAWDAEADRRRTKKKNRCILVERDIGADKVEISFSRTQRTREAMAIAIPPQSRRQC